MSALPNVMVRNIHLLKLTARATRRATGDVLQGRLQQIGQVLIVDHPANQFITHHFEGAQLASEAKEIMLPFLARAASAVVVLWVMFTSRAAVREYLQLYGLSAGQKIPKLIATYAQIRVAVWIRRPSAFLVTHDLVPTVFFAALAAAHAELPIWLILLDHAVARRYPFTARGAIGYQAHDACSVRPQPRLLLRYPPPQRWKRPEVSRGLVLAPHPALVPGAEQAISLLAKQLLGTGVFDSVAIRPHPSHAYDVSELPSGANISSPSTPLHEDVLDARCVFFVAPSSAMNTVRSVGVPSFQVNLQLLRRSDGEMPPDVSEFLRTGESNLDEIARRPCECENHPYVLDFDKREKILDLGGSAE